MKIVTYIRVSTDQQGRSGLGLEAQTASIEAYAAANAATIVGAFTEVESGRKNSRPELQAALKLARVAGARLVIAKLDRLSRNAAFLLNLQESGVDFVACDNPTATPLTPRTLAAARAAFVRALVARASSAATSARMPIVKLGNPNGAAALRCSGKGNASSCEAQRANANAFADDLADTLEGVHAAGHTTLKAQAHELNRRGIRAARGGRWHPSSVLNLRKRLQATT